MDILFVLMAFTFAFLLANILAWMLPTLKKWIVTRSVDESDIESGMFAFTFGMTKVVETLWKNRRKR